MADDALSGAWQALARTVPNHVRHAAWEALASASAQQGKNFAMQMVMKKCLDFFHLRIKLCDGPCIRLYIDYA